MSGILKINAVNMQTNSRHETSLKGKHLSKHSNQNLHDLVLPCEICIQNDNSG